MGNAQGHAGADSTAETYSRVVFTGLDAHNDGSGGRVLFIAEDKDSIEDPPYASSESSLRLSGSLCQSNLDALLCGPQPVDLTKHQDTQDTHLSKIPSKLSFSVTTDDTQVTHKALEIQVDMRTPWRQWDFQHQNYAIITSRETSSGFTIAPAETSPNIQLSKKQFLFLGLQFLKALQKEARSKKYWRGTAEKLRHEIHEERRRRDIVTEDLLKEKNKLIDELAHSTLHTRSLIKAKSDLNGCIEEWRRKVQELEESLATSRKDKDEERASYMSKATAEKAQLVKRLQDLSRSAHHQKMELSSLRNQNQELKKSLNICQQQIMLLESTLSSRESEVERLNAEHTSLASSMSQCLKQHEEAVQGFQQKAASMQISFSEMELCNVRLKHNLSSQEAELERLKAEHEILVSSMMQDLKCHEEAKLRAEKELADLQTRFPELELSNAVLEQTLSLKDTELETAKADHKIACTSILQDLKFHQDTKLEMDEKAASMKRKISELELQISTLKKEAEQLKCELDECRVYQNKMELQTSTLKKEAGQLKSALDECHAHQKEMELVNKRLLHHENTLIQMRSLAKRLRNEKNELLERVELLKSANEEQEDSNSSQVQALAQKLRMAKSELAVWKERCLNHSLKYTSTEDIECSASAVTGRLKKHRSFSKPASPSLSYSAASIPSHPRCEQSEGTAATFSTANYSQSQGASRLSKRSRKDPP